MFQTDAPKAGKGAESPWRAFFAGALVALVCLAAALASGRLSLPPLGFLYDDGLYLSAAQAMASGHGYALPDILGAPILVKYPPLFPLALMAALTGWKALGTPAGVGAAPWLQGANLLLSVAALGLCAVWLRDSRRLSWPLTLALIAVLATNDRWLHVSASLMSEPLYLALSMGALILADRATSGANATSSSEEDGRKRGEGALLTTLALLAVGAFYARSVGAVLILALSLWLSWRRSWRTGAVFFGACALACMPWVLHTAAHPAIVERIGDFWARTFQESYVHSLMMDLRTEYALPQLYAQGAQALASSGALALLPALDAWPQPTVWMALLPASAALWLVLAWRLARALGLASLDGAGLAASIRFHRLQLATARLSPAGLYLALYLLLLPLSGYVDHYPRFLIVAAPILLAMLLGSQSQTGPRSPGWAAWTRMAFPVTLVAGLLTANLAQLATLPSPSASWARYDAMAQALRADARRSPEPLAFWTDNCDDTYFYTLHAPARALDRFIQLPTDRLPPGPWTRDRIVALFARKAEATRQALIAHGVNRVILNRRAMVKVPGLRYISVAKIDLTGALLLQRYPGEFRPLYQDVQGISTLYEFKPEL